MTICGGRKSKQATATQESFGGQDGILGEKFSDETSTNTADDFAAFSRQSRCGSTSATPPYDHVDDERIYYARACVFFLFWLAIFFRL